MHIIFAYCAAVGTSLSYGIATIFELIGARNEKSINSLHPSHFFRLAKQTPYVTGLVFDAVGWLLSLYAVRYLPLFLVLSFVTGSLVITALLARFYLGIRVSKREVKAIGLIVVGIIVLSIIAKPGVNMEPSRSFTRVVEYGPLIIGLLGILLLRYKNRYSPLFIAAIAGLAFGGTAIISKFLSVHTADINSLFQPAAISLICYGVLGIVFLAAALQRDSINRVNSAMFAAEITVPSLIGIVFLQDRVRNNLWIIMFVGLGVVCLGIILIAADTKDVKQ